MKITIIGGGNMGGAIARSLVAQGIILPAELTIADPSDKIHQEFTRFSPGIHLVANGSQAVQEADIVIFAVKPWLMEQVCGEAESQLSAGQMILSVAAGITCKQISDYLNNLQTPIFRIIPNTAIALGQSTTFIASSNASQEQVDKIESIFARLGKTFVIEEDKMEAATALASCGIAYALRYIDAAAKGGEQLGIPYDQAQQIVSQTIAGALALLEANHSLPQQEIDKVTTPGGITLKGLEEMERCGFSQAVINGLKASK